MSKLYRSAQGRVVDIEKLRLANEDSIAVGNMRVNARGDQLGPGGKVIKTRNQIMKEYYQLNTPVARPERPTSRPKPTKPVAERKFTPVEEQLQEPLTELDKEMQDWDQTDDPQEKIEEKSKKVKK